MLIRGFTLRERRTKKQKYFHVYNFSKNTFLAGKAPLVDCLNSDKSLQGTVVFINTKSLYEWSARVGSRRRSSQSSPAALLAHFDTSALQIRDWLSVEVDMLRAQPVAVGDVDDILQQLDKQKVL
ncbi:unnamed protein product, partial [Brenthis ino]